ncbi:pyridoxine 5'-phosphate synthase [Luminiphilus sp.]|nr:pyridoxine 5'-phosphate synthase [Luminiphilus sp.]
MTVLSVNLNKVALIRNSRDTFVPSPLEFAATAIEAGAGGITVHPRPDQRHIRVTDCYDLASSLAVEFNLEGNPFAPRMPSDRDGIATYPGFMGLVEATRPAQVTLVPDTNAQLTSDHGFDLSQDAERLVPIIASLKAMGCRVSLFMDPEPKSMSAAAEIGADRVELYTESYAVAHAAGDFERVLCQFSEAAVAAHDAGLGINAGHDLNLTNLPDFTIPHLLEVSIGHALITDALRYGYAESVRRYLQALERRVAA